MAKIFLSMQNDSGDWIQRVAYTVDWYVAKQLFAEWAKILASNPSMPGTEKRESNENI